ncbi:MAG: phosphonate C-P lyase system protein PhnH [Desulfovibrionaceae bacterium]|jgi:alpha-D-ribose 1-methylphosphonate 5-triphosphate synthase subunit PhnH|nr:phosphonate C-P lyase system protein PhnH [Desulfovibrionaceae bacterium]
MSSALVHNHPSGPGRSGQEFAHDIRPGMANPVMDCQAVFRALLLTMSRPGTIATLGRRLAPPAPLTPAAAAVFLTLADMDTPVWLGDAATPELCTYLRFHCGCPIVREPGRAAFALVADGRRLPELDGFAAGHQEYPERSATLVLQVTGFDTASGVRLTGPGVNGETVLGVDGLSPGFWPAFMDNHSRFPLGYDAILCSEDEIAALPRSVRVEV